MPRKKLMMALFDGFVGKNTLSVQTNAPRQVELVTFRDGAETFVSAVDLLCTDEQLMLQPFTVRVKCDKPEKVILLGGRDTTEREIPFTWENGYVRFTAGGLVMFAMYKIQ